MSKIMYNDRAYGEIIGGGGGAGGLGGGIELTQAEYDALDQEEKDKDIIYFITDGNPELTIVNDSVPVGAIQAYAGTTPPSNWLICDGRAVNRVKYKQLFDIIGTTYGSGDGESTFNLPNLQGRVAIGQSTTYELGVNGGEATHTLVQNEIPNYRIGYMQVPVPNGHAQWSNGGVTGASVSSALGWTGKSEYVTNTSISVKANTSVIAYGWELKTNGGGATHNNMQPYLVTNYIIKAMESSIVEKEKLNFLDIFYPVGSYYETSVADFDPNISWGGTWELIQTTDDETWQTLSNECKYFKKSGIVTVTYYSSSRTITQTYQTVATLPVGYRPASDMYFSAMTVSEIGQVIGAIQGSGNILLRTSSGNATYSGFTVSFPVAEDTVSGSSYRWHRTA